MRTLCGLDNVTWCDGGFVRQDGCIGCPALFAQGGSTMDEDTWISTDDAALRLGLTPATVHRWITDGTLRARRVGNGRGRWRVSAAAVDALRPRRAARAPAPEPQPEPVPEAPPAEPFAPSPEATQRTQIATDRMLRKHRRAAARG